MVLIGNDRVDIIIVGGGVMGCSAAYQLAKDGQRVLLLEQFAIGNRYGSSHGASRLFRLAHTSTDYVKLARTAYLLWRELENESGEQLLQKAYGLDFGVTDIMDGIGGILQDAGVPFEQLNRDEISKRFPQFTLPKDTIGLYQDSYGLINADRCVSVIATQARQRGVKIVENQTVQSIRPVSDVVEVLTHGFTYRAGCVILCAGSWMKPLMYMLNLDLPLTVRNEVVVYYQPSDPVEWMPGRFPIFRHHLLGADARWGVGFPIFGQSGVKMVLDCTGPIVDPSDPDRTPDQAVVGRIRAYASGILPTLGDHIIEAETCRYTMTPDEDFIIDHHPAYQQVVVASPCSGHGFKFAPLIGRILADLAVSGKTKYPIGRFRLGRPGLTDRTG